MKCHPVFPHSRNLILGLLLMAGASSTVCAAAPAVSVQHDGTNVIVSFTGRLQTAGRVDGPYASVAGANSPHLMSATNAAPQFWRAALNDVRAIAAGRGFTLAVQNNGTLWAWGGNGYGQLGVGNTNSVVEPVQVGTNANWRTVSGGAGAYHAVAIRDDGCSGLGVTIDSGSLVWVTPTMLLIRFRWARIRFGNRSQPVGWKPSRFARMESCGPGLHECIACDAAASGRE